MRGAPWLTAAVGLAAGLAAESSSQRLKLVRNGERPDCST